MKNYTIKNDLYLLPALAFLTLTAFSSVLRHEFVDYDDFTFVVLNPHIQSGLTLDGIIWAFTAMDAEDRGSVLTVWIGRATVQTVSTKI